MAFSLLSKLSSPSYPPTLAPVGWKHLDVSQERFNPKDNFLLTLTSYMLLKLPKTGKNKICDSFFICLS